MTNDEFREDWIKRKLQCIPAQESILDAGAGQLRWKKDCEHLIYISQDFCEFNSNTNGKGLITDRWDTSGIDIVSDITCIPVGNNVYDNILCTEVLEHVPHPDLAIAEFSRIIKPKGKLILTAPFCSLTHFAPYHFCTGFNKYWYNNVLKENGFEVIEMVSNGNYFTYLCQELNRLSAMMKQYSIRGGITLHIIAKILSGFLKNCDGDNRSSEVLCFGYNVIAVKRE